MSQNSFYDPAGFLFLDFFSLDLILRLMLINILNKKKQKKIQKQVEIFFELKNLDYRYRVNVFFNVKLIKCLMSSSP